jgi:hypothetical protein
VLFQNRFLATAPAVGGGQVEATQSTCWRVGHIESVVDDVEQARQLSSRLIAAFQAAGLQYFKLQVSGATPDSLFIYDRSEPAYSYDRRSNVDEEGLSPMLEAFMRERGYLG